MSELKPFYMWAGGKTRLVKSYEYAWPDMSQYDHYVEPFFGGGAIFCWMSNTYGHLSGSIGDINDELTGVLRMVRDHPVQFTQRVRAIAEEYLAVMGKDDRKAWYYRLRSAYWLAPSPETLYVLMRLGFNGVWQTCMKSQGLFATPAGLLNQSRAEQIIDEGLIANWSAALSKVAVHTGSYDTLVLPTTGRSVIYLDPPYRHSFTNYATDFDDDAQDALTRWFVEQAAAGHKVLMSNRCLPGDTFFEDRLGEFATIKYIDVVYTAGRRKKTDSGFEAKAAREFLAVSL
jgi:DNA adenine methylase